MNMNIFLFVVFGAFWATSYCQKISDKEYALLPPVFEMDNFDRCLLLGDEALYCTIEFQLKPTDPNNPSETWKNIKILSDNPKNYKHYDLRHGICVPLTCPEVNRTDVSSQEFNETLARCYNKHKNYEEMGIEGTITKMFCQTNEPEPMDWLDNLTINGLIIYFLFVVYASFYEGCARYKPKAEYDKQMNTAWGIFISAFSIPKNWYRLKTIKETPDVIALKGIQGVRFYNMICVILAHTAMSVMVGPIENTKYPETVTEKPSNMFLSSGSYAVQTFFMISSWLLTYQMLVAFENKKEIKFKVLFWVFVNRYIRLTPPMALMVLLHSTLLKHIGNGPYWDHIVGEEYRNCRANGWTNLLYINNYVNADKMCMSQSWYLAADTQLFIFALLIIMAIKKYRNYAWYIMGTALVVGVSLTGLVAYINEFDVLFRISPEVLYRNTLTNPIWRIMVASAYTNGGSYAIGIICGYVFYRYRNEKFFQSKTKQFFWWVISFTFPNGVIYFAYPYYQDGYEYTQMESTLYWALGRNIFCVGITILLFGFTQNIGWFARWVCSWSGVQHLGRLTYSAYLVHVFLMRSRSVYVRTPVFLDDFTIFPVLLGDIAQSYIAAFFLCMFIEMPVTALQKLLIPQTKENTAIKPKEVMTTEDTPTKPKPSVDRKE